MPRRPVLNLEDFLGHWEDSKRFHVRVEAGYGDPRRSLDVTLTPPQGEGALQERWLQLRRHNGVGCFSCGHYILDFPSSHGEHILWRNKFPGRPSVVWERRPPPPPWEPGCALGPEEQTANALAYVGSLPFSAPHVAEELALASAPPLASWLANEAVEGALTLAPTLPSEPPRPPADEQRPTAASDAAWCCAEGQWCTCPVQCCPVLLQEKATPPPDPAPLAAAPPAAPPAAVAQGDAAGGGGVTAEQMHLRRHRLEQISRTLSCVLRHETSVPARPDGYCRLAHVMALRRFRRLGCTEEDIFQVVQGVHECGNSKQRFSLSRREDGCMLIRANQGHSRKDVLSELACRRLLPSDPELPEPCVHGTYWRHWESICQLGLLAGGLERWRNDAHFACEDPLQPGRRAVSGLRLDCEVAIWLDLRLAVEEGLPFFVSANGVILSPGDADGCISTRYFKQVADLRCCPPRWLLAPAPPTAARPPPGAGGGGAAGGGGGGGGTGGDAGGGAGAAVAMPLRGAAP